jgi:hypothetical protein
MPIHAHFTTFYLRIQLTEVVSGAKQVLKGLCPHEQLHHSTALCPKVVTDKVGTRSLRCCVSAVCCSFLRGCWQGSVRS